ncbi:FMN-binding protein [Iocasia frigidifontis]|uniref:FMN-binding protein n=1 Tax=Iocasia fonsfrigidae TaxID=2682810 RepID=A0A8A7KHQ4_9FIRM|nr:MULTISPECIES: FMN-binding protein [Halanaerobiaceae]AZO96300.1 FMN-binding protein [Halocella sp. SP3-1]MTI59650.1 FMN-binding protein [Bacillota bacterium]QTL99079.1 FMN-binding protein [Iocasia fonsfrigidae]
MLSKKKVILLILGLIIIILGIKGVAYYNDLKTYQEQVNDITISQIDLSQIADGVYQGSYEVKWVAAEVKVIVKDNKIVDIELLKHKNGRGEAAEVIIPKVIEEQTLGVDVITGATSSSKVILKAIEEALSSN